MIDFFTGVIGILCFIDSSYCNDQPIINNVEVVIQQADSLSNIGELEEALRRVVYARESQPEAPQLRQKYQELKIRIQDERRQDLPESLAQLNGYYIKVIRLAGTGEAVKDRTKLLQQKLSAAGFPAPFLDNQARKEKNIEKLLGQMPGAGITVCYHKDDEVAAGELLKKFIEKEVFPSFSVNALRLAEEGKSDEILEVVVNP